MGRKDELTEGKWMRATDAVAVKAVLFDLDDTLFDHRYASRCALATLQSTYALFGAVSLDALEGIHRRLLEELHRDMLAGKWTLAAARTERYRLLFVEHGHTPSQELVEEVTTAARTTYVANRQVVTGTLELLYQLRKHGLKIGIVTNNLQAEQVEKLAVCGLTDLVDVMVTAEEVGTSKPNPVMFELTLERLGVTADEVVMVGDSWESDVVGAWNAGIRHIYWLNRYGEDCPDATLATAIDTLDKVLF